MGNQFSKEEKNENTNNVNKAISWWISMKIGAIDTNVFKTNDQECNGFEDCCCIRRIMTALSYYNKISSQEPQKFIEFCDKYYSKQYLEDYIHFICNHKNDINALEIENTTCSSVNGCLSTTRHYRDRRVTEDNNNEIPHLCTD
eukprot:244762_1